MPYTPAQCRAFAVKAAKGQKVPSDWEKHCKKGAKKSHGRKVKKKS